MFCYTDHRKYLPQKVSPRLSKLTINGKWCSPPGLESISADVARHVLLFRDMYFIFFHN